MTQTELDTIRRAVKLAYDQIRDLHMHPRNRTVDTAGTLGNICGFLKWGNCPDDAVLRLRDEAFALRKKLMDRLPSGGLVK